MKYLFLFAIALLPYTSTAQSLISIDPDSALQGQNITTTVTASGFYFTQGSGPSSCCNFYMYNSTTYIYPNWVNILDDDHFEANWSIPSNAAPGNYVVEYEFYDPWFPWGGTLYATVPGGFTVVSCPAPTVTISANGATTFCSGGSVVLTAISIPGVTYQWYRYGVVIPNATGLSYTATTSGYYSVKIFTATGCNSSSNNISVSTLSLPAATIGWSSPPQFCPGGSATLVANIASGYFYQWYLNGIIIPSATAHTYNATVAGSYTVRVTNSNGCSKISLPATVTALTAPTASITPSGPQTFCAGTGVTLSANSGTGYAYQWYKYGNIIPGATSQSLFVNNSAKYKVQVTNTSGCTKNSASVTTTSIPLPPAVITAQGATTFCAGDSVVLSANTGAGLTYQWRKYSNAISGATLPNYTAKTAGKYKAVVTNTYGCSRTSNAITVSTPCRIQNAQTPEDEVIFTVDRSQQKLFVTGSESRTIEVISIDGKVVIRVNSYDPSGIDLSQLPGGMYVAVTRTEKETFSHKFYYSRED